MSTSKQSIAGGLLQTLTRLCTAIGYGIGTAIFDTVKRNPSGRGYYANNAAEPFAAVYWFTAGCAFVGLLFVPFLRIGTQGHKGDTGRIQGDAEREMGVDVEKDAVAGTGKDEGDNAEWNKQI